MGFFEEIEGVFRLVGGVDLVVVEPEETGDAVAHGFVVFDYEDGLALGGGEAFGEAFVDLLVLDFLRGDDGEEDAEAGAFSFF